MIDDSYFGRDSILRKLLLAACAVFFAFSYYKYYAEVGVITNKTLQNKDVNDIKSTLSAEQPAVTVVGKESTDNAKTIAHHTETDTTPTTQQIYDMSVYEDDLVFGKEDAQITIIEYYAFTCPHCYSYFINAFPEITKELIDTGKVRYVKREYVATAQDAAAASLSRCDISKRNAFTKVLLEQQENWAYKKDYIEVLSNIALLGGVSTSTFEKCRNDTNIKSIFLRNAKHANTHSTLFKGTPSFIINGEMYNYIGALNAQTIIAEVNRRLK